ncbi:MAG: glucose-phosphate thymidylyltransferase [Symbiobacteriaceae bacterium]|jgi:glucose-1-phosphate thymidylyltransferase|nr:glucose-phosphate thymidylyltransferase [Symbiobacteriaceae bacterium]
MKALVLCAGRGTRLRPLTHTRAKAALPVAGRPVLAHILSYLHGNGFFDVGVVISPDQEELRTLAAAAPGQRVEFIIQRTPLGIAHAVQEAAGYLGQEPFLLYLGDNLTDEDLHPALDQFGNTNADAVIAVRRVANPRAFGIAELDGERLAAVAEKPAVPKSDLAIAGIYLFRSSVHEVIGQLRPSGRGEYEITDAIAGLIAGGRNVVAHRMTGWWQDMGSPEGMLAANALLLDTITTDIDANVDLSTTKLQGRVIIGPGVTLQNVRLRGPLVIGPGSHLEDAYIGPYTSVGDAAWIRGAALENSILLPGCRLDAPTIHLEDCLLGRGAVVETKTGRAVTLLLGDDGRLQIPPGRR